MEPQALKNLLAAVAAGDVDVPAAMERLRSLPFENLGFACVDHHRGLRCGQPEVIFGEGKTPAQIETIFARLAAQGGNVLATRVSSAAAKPILERYPVAEYHESARMLTLRQQPASPTEGIVGLVCAGTSDLPVAEEARITLELLDQRVATYYDVGVAGLHRLLAHAEALRAARVLIVVAGMEGALPSVVAGLVGAPVIAVPTSVGYGASFQGLAALLGMLNTCAPGVSVVNIDNGFGAACQAALINRLGEQPVAADGSSADRSSAGCSLADGSSADRSSADGSSADRSSAGCSLADGSSADGSSADRSSAGCFLPDRCLPSSSSADRASPAAAQSDARTADERGKK